MALSSEGAYGPRKPLEGIRVLAVELLRAGPTASLLLANFGGLLGYSEGEMESLRCEGII